MKIVIYSLNDVNPIFIYWKKIAIDTLNDTHKKIPQNHTQILYYKNSSSKMGKNIHTPKYCRTIPPSLACVHTHKPANEKFKFKIKKHKIIIEYNYIKLIS